MIWNSNRQSVSGSVIPLGFILVVSIISVTLVVVSSTTFPALSKKAEINAHQDLATDFIRLDSAVYQTATTGVPHPVVMGNRVEYPPHPSPIRTPTPRFRSLDSYNSTVENAVYADNLSTYTATRNTKSLLASRTYNYFTTARELGYEHGIFYTQPEDANPGSSEILARDKQTIINGQVITLVSIEGHVSYARPSPTQLTFESIPDETDHVRITNDSGTAVTLTLPTRLPQSEWNRLLESELVSNGGHISDIRYSLTNPSTGSEDGVNYVTIELESGIDYSLNLYSIEIKKY